MCLLYLSTMTSQKIGTVLNIFLLSLGTLGMFYYMALKIVLFNQFFKLQNHSATTIIFFFFSILGHLCFLISGKYGLQKIPKPHSYMKMDTGILHAFVKYMHICNLVHLTNTNLF